MSGPRPGVMPTGSRPAGAGATGAVRAAFEFLDRALDPAFGPGELRAVTLGVPGGPPERLLRLAGDEPAVFWDAASGPTVAGWGAAWTVEAAGEHRFDMVRTAAEALWPRITPVAQPALAAIPPRLFGGFSFLPRPLPAPWHSFGQAKFILPRLLYAPEDTGGRLMVVVDRADREESRREQLRDVIRGALRLLAASGTGQDAPPAGIEALGDTDPAQWAAAVDSIRARIRGGRADKIVAARMREVRIPGGVDVAAVLRRLRAGTAAEARFALRFEGATFLGATPERLVSLRGREIRTEALAGSIDADRADRTEELLASVKDAAEHAYVVRAIVEALGPLCERLDHPPEPRIQRLRHVLHLQTPFTGRLARPAHVLGLVERLHPTPAVGGTPTSEAVAWIAEHEPGCRGWYAAPVGWFDGEGDGDFVVALRSALLTGERARLYAGAGIVRDSGAAAELAETEVKLRTMADALGWRP